MEPWQQGTEVAGYVLQEKLWSDASGVEAWRALDLPNRVVEVQIVPHRDAAGAQRYLNGVQARSRLRHPGLLVLLSLACHKDTCLISYEATEGSLRDRLTQCLEAGKPGIPSRELLRYVQPAAAALDYLHAEGFLHCDVSPDAIRIKGSEGRLGKLNLATPIEDLRKLPKGTCVGTPRYMAPEQIQSMPVPVSDQYSLAITWAELRLQRPLFPQESVLQVMMAHLQTLPNLAPLPADEQQVLLRALAKTPGQRYPSCCAFVQALSEVLS